MDEQPLKNVREIFRDGLKNFDRYGIQKLRQTSAELKDFFLSLCDLESDQPLLIALHITFQHYFKEVNKKKRGSSAFLGLLTILASKAFLSENHPNRVLNDHITKDSKDPNKESTSAERKLFIEYCLPFITKELHETTLLKTGLVSPVLTFILKKQKGLPKKEQRRTILIVLSAYFQGKKGKFIINLDKLPSKVQRDLKFNFLFPEALEALQRSLLDDLRAGEDSLIAGFFEDYADRRGVRKTYPSIGRFLTTLIRLKGVDPEVRARAALECLYIMFAIFLDERFDVGKFDKSAFIGRSIRALKGFIFNAAELSKYKKFERKADKDKSFTHAERVFCLNIFRKSIATILNKPEDQLPKDAQLLKIFWSVLDKKTPLDLRVNTLSVLTDLLAANEADLDVEKMMIFARKMCEAETLILADEKKRSSVLHKTKVRRSGIEYMNAPDSAAQSTGSDESEHNGVSGQLVAESTSMVEANASPVQAQRDAVGIRAMLEKSEADANRLSRTSTEEIRVENGSTNAAMANSK